MRFILGAAALAALTACSPGIPDSGGGVGFGDYEEYQRKKAARETALAGDALPPADSISPESESTGDVVTSGAMTATAEVSDDSAEAAGTQDNGSDESAEIAAETQAALAETQANSGEPVVHADPANPPPETVTTASGISEENDFEAVGAQRSIESDAALIARNRAQYKVIEPEALPVRSGDTGPNIVDYALSTTHSAGTQLYRRVGFNKEGRFKRNCAKYASPDQAQAAFLSRGGPERDRLGLDPDGDGYACAWDPAPFRKAVGG